MQPGVATSAREGYGCMLASGRCGKLAGHVLPVGSTGLACETGLRGQGLCREGRAFNTKIQGPASGRLEQTQALPGSTIPHARPGESQGLAGSHAGSICSHAQRAVASGQLSKPRATREATPLSPNPAPGQAAWAAFTQQPSDANSRDKGDTARSSRVLFDFKKALGMNSATNSMTGGPKAEPPMPAARAPLCSWLLSLQWVEPKPPDPNVSPQPWVEFGSRSDLWGCGRNFVNVPKSFAEIGGRDSHSNQSPCLHPSPQHLGLAQTAAVHEEGLFQPRACHRYEDYSSVARSVQLCWHNV